VLVTLLCSRPASKVYPGHPWSFFTRSFKHHAQYQNRQKSGLEHHGAQLCDVLTSVFSLYVRSIQSDSVCGKTTQSRSFPHPRRNLGESSARCRSSYPKTEILDLTPTSRLARIQQNCRANQTVNCRGRVHQSCRALLIPLR
jgi:hypothetical protein